MAEAKRGICRVGTSGWSYPHWGKGRFYPVGLPAGKWLSYLAEHLDTVELNASFYRPPRPAMIQRWRDALPVGFPMAVKLWRRITHDKKLADCGQEIRDFLEIVNELGTRRGPMLVQLPPSLHKDLARLEAFLEELKAAMGRRRWRVAVEFRHASWLEDATRELLDRFDVAMVLADMPRCATDQANRASFVYVRRHGPGGRYRGCYSPEMLAEDARRIRGWLEEGRDVYVYFNNDVEGYAIDNARQLKAMISGGG